MHTAAALTVGHHGGGRVSVTVWGRDLGAAWPAPVCAPVGGREGVCVRLRLRLSVCMTVTHPLRPPLTRSVEMFRLGPLCFLFSVLSSRPLPLTPRAAH